MRLSKEIKIAVLVLACLLLVVYGYYYLRGYNLFKTQSKYYAKYSNVEGLIIGSPIQVSGFTVGKVSDIFFDPGQVGQVIVELQIDNPNIQVTKESIAKISSLDLLGSKCVALDLSKQGAALEKGDTLLSATELSLKDEVNMQVLPLKTKVESLLSQFDSTFQAVQGIFDKTMQENISTRLNNTFVSLENIAHVTDVMMVTNAQKMNNTMTNMESITENLKGNNEKLGRIMQNTANITDTLVRLNITHTFQRVDSVITNFSALMARIQKGEGSAGKLLKDEALYNNLDQATLELDRLLEDMRVNPKRYVHFSIFGKKEKEEEKPDKKERTP